MKKLKWEICLAFIPTMQHSPCPSPFYFVHYIPFTELMTFHFTPISGDLFGELLGRNTQPASSWLGEFGQYRRGGRSPVVREHRESAKEED